MSRREPTPEEAKELKELETKLIKEGKVKPPETNTPKK